MVPALRKRATFNTNEVKSRPRQGENQTRDGARGEVDKATVRDASRQRGQQARARLHVP